MNSLDRYHIKVTTRNNCSYRYVRSERTVEVYWKPGDGREAHLRTLHFETIIAAKRFMADA